MRIKGFRVARKSDKAVLPAEENIFTWMSVNTSLCDIQCTYDVTHMKLDDFYPQFHTGAYDSNGKMIFEGDFLRSKSCPEPFEVKDIVSFLMMCGEYKAKNGVDIFDSLEVIGSDIIPLRD